MAALDVLLVRNVVDGVHRAIQRDVGKSLHLITVRREAASATRSSICVGADQPRGERDAPAGVSGNRVRH